MTALPDPRRKRLLFRSWHRGTKEADLIMGSFAEAHLAGFSEAELDEFEKCIDEGGRAQDALIETRVNFCRNQIKGSK